MVSRDYYYTTEAYLLNGKDLGKVDFHQDLIEYMANTGITTDPSASPAPIIDYPYYYQRMQNYCAWGWKIKNMMDDLLIEMQEMRLNFNLN
jgi:hypothetical protein